MLAESVRDKMNETNKIKIFQKGFNYSQDGRGNRLILHLQGCNMKCPWCSNPEGMPLEGVLMTERRRNRLSYKEYAIDEIVTECVRSKPMFFDGGGVTLTGGEITMQFEAVKELLQRLKKEDIHTAIESNGSHPQMEELVPFVDQWIMDVKHYDDVKHKAWLGVSNENTTKTLCNVSKVHEDMLVRVPLIPGFNDCEEDARCFADYFIRNMSSKVRVEFLAYHEFGKEKWKQCGMEYKMPNVRLLPGTVKMFENIMRENGIICVRT